MARLRTPKRDTEPPAPRVDAVKDGHLLVAASPCDECLFSKHRLVSERRKRAILRECYVKGTYFICHKATLAGRAVICHNFAKSTDGAGNVALRVAQFFNIIRYVDPATGKASPSKKGRATDPDFVPLTQIVDDAAKLSRSKRRPP